ncbi:hypothetical protein GIJ38_06500 [Morganella morganii]|nr:hypothetical protein [Morganella morganii]
MVENNIHAALLCFFTSLIGLRKEFKPRTDFRIVKMLLLLTDLHIFPADDFPPEKNQRSFFRQPVRCFQRICYVNHQYAVFLVKQTKKHIFFHGVY